MRKIISIVGALFLSLAFSSCDGGYDCPLDPPECCYNVLTGCQLFDMPQWCSCSQYGLYSAQLKKASASIETLQQYISRPGLSGSWRGILRRAYSVCPASLPQVSGVVSIRQKKTRVYVTVPGYGVLRGRTNKRGFSAQGTYRAFNVCTARASLNFKSKTRGSGEADAAVSTSCFSTQGQCTMKYRGTVFRQL